MPIDAIPVSLAWKALRFVPFVARWFFPKDKLARLVLVDVRPRHSYATVNLGEVATYELWFQAINLSPFEVEIDRAQVEFWCGGVILKDSILNKIALPAGSSKEFFVRGAIPDGHANQIARHVKNHQSAVSMHLEFNCALHGFSKVTGHLDGMEPHFLNADARIKVS